MADSFELPNTGLSTKGQVLAPDDHVSVKVNVGTLPRRAEDAFPEGTLWGWLSVVGVCL